MAFMQTSLARLSPAQNLSRSTFGGGPGASAMLQPFTGQEHCLITPNGTKPNANRITECFNLLALEHEWANHLFRILRQDVYSVHRNRHTPRVETKRTSTTHINLSHRQDVYDDATCTKLYGIHPACLEDIEASLQNTGMSIEAMSARQVTEELCLSISRGGVKNGTFLFDMRLKCFNSNRLDCMPRLSWMDQFFQDVDTKNALGVPLPVLVSVLNFLAMVKQPQVSCRLTYYTSRSFTTRMTSSDLASAQDAMCQVFVVFSLLVHARKVKNDILVAHCLLGGLRQSKAPAHLVLPTYPVFGTPADRWALSGSDNVRVGKLESTSIPDPQPP
ncbi:hypothetical protein B0H19DRAFT_1055098 [Mycena capillaripes]|nr:hypothetical protein B0H19DRAFT_1055098 [Mycena capillaripes]